MIHSMYPIETHWSHTHTWSWLEFAAVTIKNVGDFEMRKRPCCYFYREMCMFDTVDNINLQNVNSSVLVNPPLF